MDRLMRASHVGSVFFATSIMFMYTTGFIFRNRGNTARVFAKYFPSFRLLSTFHAEPPIAKKIPGKVYFGINPINKEQNRGTNPMDPPIVREDPFFWMRDDTRKDPTVLAHLKAENDYCAGKMAKLAPLQEELYQEMISHLQQTDEEVPHRHGDYFYYSKTQMGLSYRIHCRRVGNADGTMGPEQVILDENALAKGHEYSDMSSFSPSPSHSMLAYTIDNTGYETYTMKIITDIATGTESKVDVLEEVDGDIIWGADDSTLFYFVLDDEHRPHKLYMHVLGTPQSEDICIYTEEDSMFWMHVGKTADDKFLIFGSDSKETSENYAIDLRGVRGGVSAATADSTDSAASSSNSSFVSHKDAVANVACLRRRQFGVRYEVEHHEGYFYFTTNADGAKNCKIMRLSAESYFPLPPPSQDLSPAAAVPRAKSISSTDAWTDIRAYDPAEQIDDILPFKDFIAVFGRKNGIQQLWVIEGISGEGKGKTLGSWRPVEFKESVYSIRPSHNFVYTGKKLRLSYSSLVTPRQILDYEMATGKFDVLKETPVPGYDRTKYESCRLEALARDGKTKIPMSIVFNKHAVAAVGAAASVGASCSRVQLSPEQREQLPLALRSLAEKDCRFPVLLYGYGSYGACMDPSFDFKRSALLDRGVIYVIAHIRGGGEMGRGWYEDEGKYLTKLNTFTDFADCATYLSKNLRLTTSEEQMAIVGRSAGGLLIGACVNMFPSLFKAAVADVPFVDVINTMSDPTIPLTATEWEEWGNPNEEKYHEYMKSYSPYDNVVPQRYPAMLVTAGLNDPRVAYWEPSKWVARLREAKAEHLRHTTDPNNSMGTKEGENEEVEDSPLLLKTDMSSGHFSASDRYKYIRETAFEYSFILDQIGATKKLD